MSVKERTHLMARRAAPARPRDDGSVTDDRRGAANRSYRGPAPVRHRVWAYLAAAWAIIFAAPHVYWATGHTAGLGTGLSNSNGTAITNMSWALQLACAGVAVFCLCGAGTALATLRSWTPRWRPLARRVLLGLAWLGAALLIARSIDVYVEFNLGLTGIWHIPAAQHGTFLHLARWFMFFWLPWFALGALAWTRLARTFAQSSPAGVADVVVRREEPHLAGGSADDERTSG
jgi:hypothetical protein